MPISASISPMSVASSASFSPATSSTGSRVRAAPTKSFRRSNRRARASAATLLDYKVRTRSGQQVPISSFATLETTTAPRTLARFQQADSFRVYGGVVPGVTKAAGLDALEAAAKEILPPGYTVDYAGESRQIRQEGTTLAGTLGFSILLIYLVLAAQFGSFRDPLVVLLGFRSARVIGGPRLHLPRLHNDQHLQPDRADHPRRA